MPLHKIAWTGNQCGWALWNCTEAEPVLAELVHPEVCPEDIFRPSKRIEWLTGRLLLRHLLEAAGLRYHGLYKDEFGKPFLNKHPHAISLSHSYPFVAAQIDLYSPVGIDVEQPKPKLLRIASRVLGPPEEADAGTDIIKHCIYWCAKEAMYKIHGRRGLTFSDHLLIQPFLLKQTGDLTGNIFAQGSDRLVNLVYSVDKDYVLVYTKTPIK